MSRYDREHTLFFVDPPYWGTEGYGVAFPLEEYDQIAGMLRTMKGKAIITVNDIPEMRKAFAGLRISRVRIAYTVGGAKRAKPTAELIIRNW